MASRQETVDYIVDQASGAGDVSARKMFGEYGVYCRGKFIALICDDRLFIKPTDQGVALLGEPEMEPPYPGARNHPVVDEERWDDSDFLTQLFAETADALPAPKPKKKKAKT